METLTYLSVFLTRKVALRALSLESACNMEEEVVVKLENIT